MKTHMALRSLVVAVAAAIGASTAAAQEPDDFSFAKRLAYRGWFDLAKDICDRIEKDNSMPRDARSALPILLAEIELAKADRETDPKKALEFMSGSISRLQKFIADEERHPRIFEAHINIGYLKSRKAKALVDQIEGAKTAEEHDRLRQEAATLYAEITADFEKSAQDWRRIQPPTPEIDGAIMDARLESERARYENARIPGIPEEDRKKLLGDAIKHLVDFEIDYGDTAKAFEAMLLEGRCLYEMGEYAQAETKLKNTMGLDGILRKEKIPRNDYFDQIIFGAYLTTAQIQLKTNRPKDAKAFIDDKLATDPSASKSWIGLALKVEKVEALHRLKESNAARILAEDVIKSDPTGPFGAKMKDRLANLSTRGGPGRGIEPDQGIRAAEGLLEKGRLRDAMAMLRQAIEGCTTEEQRTKNVPRALFLMGQCLQDMHRNYEAAIVYEKIVSQYASHELGVKACWEAVVCYSNEFDTFEDPQDEREKDRLMQTLLDRWKGAKEADNIPYLQGLKLENAKKLREAADKYLLVPDRAPAYERSLVRGAYCLRVDAFREFATKKGIKNDAAAMQAVKDQLARAEELFKKFLHRVETLPAENAESARDRASLVIVVNQELAFLYNHELVGKAEESLKFLEKVAKDMSADDDRMARIHRLQVQSQLVLNKNDEAVKTLELLMDRFPHAKETAEACKSVAIRLDEITIKMDPNSDAAKENLKKISRYYGKWLDGAMRFSMNASVNDVMAVGATLYMTAKQLNNLPKEVFSFMDMKKGMIVAWKNYFEEAEFVHALLVSDKFKGIAPRDRLELMTRRARCLSFIADSADGWNRAKGAYEDIVKEYGIKDPKGAFVPGTLTKTPVLVGVYIEMGAVYFELGRWNKIHYDNAISTFADIMSIAGNGGEPWWIAKYMLAISHFRRGKDKDIMTAQTIIRMLQENYPDFDGGKYGLKDKFIELKKQIDQVK
jgi:tetratricopeptide (TPR) repeat protein